MRQYCPPRHHHLYPSFPWRLQGRRLRCHPPHPHLCPRFRWRLQGRHLRCHQRRLRPCPTFRLHCSGIRPRCRRHRRCRCPSSRLHRSGRRSLSPTSWSVSSDGVILREGIESSGTPSEWCQCCRSHRLGSHPRCRPHRLHPYRPIVFVVDEGTRWSERRRYLNPQDNRRAYGQFRGVWTGVEGVGCHRCRRPRPQEIMTAVLVRVENQIRRPCSLALGAEVLASSTPSLSSSVSSPRPGSRRGRSR